MSTNSQDTSVSRAMTQPANQFLIARSASPSSQWLFLFFSFKPSDSSLFTSCLTHLFVLPVWFLGCPFMHYISGNFLRLSVLFCFPVFSFRLCFALLLCSNSLWLQHSLILYRFLFVCLFSPVYEVLPNLQLWILCQFVVWPFSFVFVICCSI